MTKNEKYLMYGGLAALALYALKFVDIWKVNEGNGQYDKPSIDLKPAIQVYLKRIQKNNVLMYINQILPKFSWINNVNGYKFIKALILRESSGVASPVPKGSSGEIGLCQITKGALTEVNNRFGTTFKHPSDLENPFNNILIAVYYLTYLQAKYLKDKNQDSEFWRQLACAYNGGSPNNLNAQSYGRAIVSSMKDFS